MQSPASPAQTRRYGRFLGRVESLRARWAARTVRDEIVDAFDADWYRQEDPYIATARIDPVLHWLTRGIHEGRDPHPLFDTTWYLQQNPDVAGSGVNPFLHYLRSGGFERRDPNPHLDSDWYLATYPDVAAAGINPLLHYARSGAAEGRDPNPLFDTSWYLDTYPDVVRRGLNPLAHFLRHGEREGRLPGPLCSRRTIPTPQTARATGDGFLGDAASLEDPEVTILIPVHGAWHWTERCLGALAQTEAVHRARIVVVNDASPDDTLDRLRAYAWVEVVSAAENLGFVGAVNLGISRRQTPHVLLLNNDTEPLSGFLDAMLGRLNRELDVGVVGARLVYPDGRLQDAGSIVWATGEGWNYGRYEDPDAAAYLHSRDVDYCTGAAILVRGDVLEKTGGLDERYRPAYYEDTDLAFTVRALGYRVVYEPEATVVHHEGGTHGTDEETGGKSHQVANREVFRARWRAELREQVAHDEVPLEIAATRGLRPILVFVDHQPLTPDKDSGSFRAMQMLKIMQELGYSVVFAALHGGKAFDADARRMRADGIQVIREPRALHDLLRSAGDWVEAVVLSRVDVAWEWWPVVRSGNPKVPVIFDTVDLHHLREHLEVELHGSRLGKLRALATEHRELAMIERSAVTIVVSEAEQAYLAKALPNAEVSVISNIHPLPARSGGWSQRKGLLFVGSFLHQANVDGLGWFLRDVWPLVDPVVRSGGFDIVGASIPPDLAAYASDEIRVHGWVADLEPLLRKARLSVAPLRYGAGVKGKIGEAWSYGLPVVGTSVALEAMLSSAETHDVVADDPEAMARRIAELYVDEGRWNRASDAGRARVEERFSVGEARTRLSRLLERLAADRANRDVSAELLARRLPPHLLRAGAGLDHE